MRRALARVVLTTQLLLTTGLLAACPPTAKDAQHHGVAQDAGTARLDVPTAPLPARGQLLEYERLRLGMSNLDISQLYNAPDGKGDGFQRLVQDFSAVQHHIVKFDVKDGEPQRKLVLALLRDELYQLVDRRDGLNLAQVTQWRNELIARYGEPASEPIAGAQWSWGPENEVLMTFTQDNASAVRMSANLVLVYRPYAEAAYHFLDGWQKAHPDYKAEELPF